MKVSSKLISFVASILIQTSFSFGQTARYLDHASGNYFSLTMGIGNALAPRGTGIISVSFPYTLYDASGNATVKQFDASHAGLYYKGYDFNQCNYITLEVGSRKLFFNYKLSGNVMVDSRVISGGRNIQLNKNWGAKISLGLAFSKPWEFSNSSTGYDSLGSVDNRNATLQMLGKTFYPTFQNSKGQSENANQLSIYYTQSNLSLIPRVSIGQGEYRHFIYWDIFLEYYLPISKQSYLNLLQNNNEPTTTVSLSKNNYVTYNGQPNSKIPAVFHGFYAGFTLGISLSQKDRDDRNRRPHEHKRPHHRMTKKKGKASKIKMPLKKDKGKDNSRGW